jgi:hypothetical protein
MSTVTPPPTPGMVQKNGHEVAALVLTVVAMLLCWLPFIGLFLAAAGLVFAVLAIRRRKSSLAIASLVLGVLAAVIGTTVTAAAVGAIVAADRALTKAQQHPPILVPQDKPDVDLSPHLPTISQGDAFLNGIDGTYRVHTDVQPGTYVSPGPRDRATVSACLWQRLKGPSGSYDDFIAGDISPGQTFIPVLPTDTYIKITGCGGPLTKTA